MLMINVNWLHDTQEHWQHDDTGDREKLSASESFKI